MEPGECVRLLTVATRLNTHTPFVLLLQVCKGYLVEELHQFWTREYDHQGSVKADMPWELFVQQKGHMKKKTAWRYRRLYWLCLDFPGMMLTGESFSSLVRLHDAIRLYLKDLVKSVTRGNPSLRATYALFADPISWLPCPNPRPHWERGDAVVTEKKLGYKVFTKNVLGYHREAYWNDTVVERTEPPPPRAGYVMSRDEGVEYNVAVPGVRRVRGPYDDRRDPSIRRYQSDDARSVASTISLTDTTAAMGDHFPSASPRDTGFATEGSPLMQMMAGGDDNRLPKTVPNLLRLHPQHQEALDTGFVDQRTALYCSQFAIDLEGVRGLGPLIATGPKADGESAVITFAQVQDLYREGLFNELS